MASRLCGCHGNGRLDGLLKMKTCGHHRNCYLFMVAMETLKRLTNGWHGNLFMFPIKTATCVVVMANKICVRLPWEQ
jgi:hypothetical protein